MAHLLELRGVDAWYGQTQVLRAMRLTVGEGGITALLGANGAGKTSTLRAISRIIVRSEGEMLLAGGSIAHLKPEAIVRAGVAHVPDGRGTFVQQSVEENLRLGAYTRSAQGDIAQDLKKIYEMFPKLWERRTQQAGMLSGGEQQMLAIGRALMLRPRLMLLDEPSFGLAPLIVRSIFETLGTVSRREGVGILLVEQNANLTLEVADYAYLIDAGSVVHEGLPADLRRDETIRRVYLGH